MPPNPYENFSLSPTSPAQSLFTITPNSGADLPNIARMIYVGVGGDVVLIDSKGTTVTHKNVPSGSYIGPFYAARVMALGSGTTATDMVGYV